MIVGIDGNEANVAKRVGIGEYAHRLLDEFSRTKKKNLKFVIYLKNHPLDHMPEENATFKYKIIGPKKLWTQFALPLALLVGKNKPDIFFTPSHYAPRIALMPTAISIMDVSYLHFPDLFAKKDLYQLKRWTAYSAKQARKIFTISEASKNDIIKYYHVSPENVIVTYPGIKDMMSSKQQVKPAFSLPNKYILFVGTLQPRKNLNRLIEAFSSIAKEFPQIDLVIVGKKGWLYEAILSSPEKFNIAGKVHFLDFVDDNDLPFLYKNAEFFILPSLYEGFGLPILEAMQYDCPVIASNVSSLPEAGGDACLYVNPEDVLDIADKMRQLLKDSDLRKSLIEKGKNQLKNFSWKKTALETLQVLESVAKK